MAGNRAEHPFQWSCGHYALEDPGLTRLCSLQDYLFGMTPDDPRGHMFVRALGYPLMIGGAIGLFLLVRAAGSRLVAPAPPGAAPVSRVGTTSGAPADADMLLHVLLALVVVIVAARIC